MIGIFQTVNERNGEKEWSMTRIQMAIMTAFDIVFLWFFFIEKGNEVTMNNIVLTLILLLAAVAPKALKDISASKLKGRDVS